MKLLVTGILRFTMGLIIVMGLLFIPAGSLLYKQAWLLIMILFVPMFIAGLVMFVKNKYLLEKRLNNKENEDEQKIVILLSAGMFILAFVFAGLSYRFHWLMPIWVSYIGTIIFLISYALYGEVLRENTYLSRTIEVQENQKVIDTGLYGIVRHPMYSVTIFLFLSMPLVLGSWISFIIMLSYLPIIAKRIKNEEEVLEKGLSGYKEYKQKVEYKVLPYLW